MKTRRGLACATAIAVLLGGRAASADAGDTCVSAYEGAQQDKQRGAFIAQVEKELGGADRVNLLKDEPCKEAW